MGSDVGVFSWGWAGVWVAGVLGSSFLGAGAVAAALGALSPLKTDFVPLAERIHSPMDVNMKRMAQAVVILDIRLADPRAPKAVWLPTPPKAPARSADLPDWRRTAKIRMKQTMMWMMMINVVTFLTLPRMP